MAKILMAWELGGGFGHARRLADLANALVARGHDVAVAAADPEKVRQCGFHGSELQMIPQWPGIATSSTKTVLAATFGDLLAELIFRNEAEITERIGLWDRVFSSFKTELLLADYAPGAVLAARGKLSIVNIGDSYYLPPPELPRFPHLFKTAPRYSEAQATERINLALAKFSREPLSAFPDVCRADATLVTNFPALDIYASTRGFAAIGPLAKMPSINSARPKNLFGYFGSGTEFNPRIVNGLLGSGCSGRVVIPGLRSNPVKDHFTTPLKFTSQLADLSTAFEGTAVFASHGGAQTMAAALCAGVPQVVVAIDDEKGLLGRCIADLGAGISLRAENLQSKDLGAAIRLVATEPKFRRAALALSKQCHAIMHEAPMEKAILKIEELI